MSFVNFVGAGHFRVASIAASLVLTVVYTSRLTGQEDSVKAITDAGGRVSQISAAGPEKEINFSLSGKEVSDEILQHVAKVENVIWLNLRGTKITDKGLANIAGMETLVRLHLEKTQIGDEGLKHLVGLKNLTYLNLYATNVTDAGVVNLEPLSGLKKLYVWQSKVTEEGIKALGAKMPELEIVGELKLATSEVKEKGETGEMKKTPPEKKKADKAKGKKADKTKKG